MIYTSMFTPEDYDLIEKWFGLVFASSTSKHKPNENDKKLLAKITMLHLLEVQTETKIRDIINRDDDEE